MRYRDMLIDTPYKLSEIEDRSVKAGHPHENRCSYCVGQKNYTWYPIEDIIVVRRWRTKSVHRPDLDGAETGGWYSWRCPNHPFPVGPSSNAHNAPEYLRPKLVHRCKVTILGRPCGEPAMGAFDGRWLCEDHARPIILEQRLRGLIDETLEEDFDDPNNATGSDEVAL